MAGSKKLFAWRFTQRRVDMEITKSGRPGPKVGVNHRRLTEYERTCRGLPFHGDSSMLDHHATLDVPGGV
jgi:hypothetical protein